MSDSEYNVNDEVWVEEIKVDPAHLGTDLATLGFRQTGEKGVADPGQAMLAPGHDLVHVRSTAANSDVIAAAKREVEAASGEEIEPAVVEAGEAMVEFLTALADAEYAEAGYEKLERIPQAAGGVR